MSQGSRQSTTIATPLCALKRFHMHILIVNYPRNRPGSKRRERRLLAPAQRSIWTLLKQMFQSDMTYCCQKSRQRRRINSFKRLNKYRLRCVRYMLWTEERDLTYLTPLQRCRFSAVLQVTISPNCNRNWKVSLASSAACSHSWIPILVCNQKELLCEWRS